jgi:hypothetical protein
MARFLGATASKGGTPSITIVPTTAYTRSTGITTDGSNNVTAITLGDVTYSSVLYNAVGLITSYTETISGNSKNFVLAYDAGYKVTSITQV